MLETVEREADQIEKEFFAKLFSDLAVFDFEIN